MNEELRTKIEALIFSAPEPVPVDRLAKYLKVEEDDVRRFVERLNEEYLKEQRAFYIREIAKGYQFYLKEDLGTIVREFHRIEKRRLSKGALDVLAIIAVKQPVTKRVIELIRRASSESVLHNLLELGLIKIVGRAPGSNAYLYATTNKFLTTFGLKDLSELPSKEELERFIEYSGELFPESVNSTPETQVEENNDK